MAPCKRWSLCSVLTFCFLSFACLSLYSVCVHVFGNVLRLSVSGIGFLQEALPAWLTLMEAVTNYSPVCNRSVAGEFVSSRLHLRLKNSLDAILLHKLWCFLSFELWWYSVYLLVNKLPPSLALRNSFINLLTFSAHNKPVELFIHVCHLSPRLSLSHDSKDLGLGAPADISVMTHMKPFFLF